ncbi:MAG: hypothetical protein AAGM27_08730 [Cyanobacteria bacterium J06554_3]
MATSLEKFRAQYPNGGLTAELVSINDGQYVVRAAVSHQGVLLATGFATSVDIQIAEDKARDRALSLLGIVSNDSAVQAPPQPVQTTEPIQPAVTVPVVAATTPESEPQPIDEESPAIAPDENAVPPAEDDTGPPIDEVAEAPLENAPAAKTSAATIALENFDANVGRIDLSDVIAQTDVELTRLGWTSVQGREYLEKTYGKRSRQQLTDEELMSFLLYLEEL